MEEITIKTFIALPWAAVGGMFIWFVLKPLTEHFINKDKSDKDVI